MWSSICTARPKVLILNYPHNPTAITVDPPFFDKVVALAKEFGVAVIHDFAYGRTCFDSYKAPSFLSAKGAKDVGRRDFTTMSKPYNMAGWRIGFCAGNRAMVEALATIKGYYDYGIFAPVPDCPRLSQCGIARMTWRSRLGFMRSVGTWWWRGAGELGWQVEAPRASMFVWARVKDEHLAGQSTIEFSMRMMEDAEVALAPGRAFGENGEGYVRIALVENEQRLRQAIRQLARALNPSRVTRAEA